MRASGSSKEGSTRALAERWSSPRTNRRLLLRRSRPHCRPSSKRPRRGHRWRAASQSPWLNLAAFLSTFQRPTALPGSSRAPIRRCSEADMQCKVKYHRFGNEKRAERESRRTSFATKSRNQLLLFESILWRGSLKTISLGMRNRHLSPRSGAPRSGQVPPSQGRLTPAAVRGPCGISTCLNHGPLVYCTPSAPRVVLPGACCAP